MTHYNVGVVYGTAAPLNNTIHEHGVELPEHAVIISADMVPYRKDPGMVRMKVTYYRPTEE